MKPLHSIMPAITPQILTAVSYITNTYTEYRRFHILNGQLQFWHNGLWRPLPPEAYQHPEHNTPAHHTRALAYIESIA